MGKPFIRSANYDRASLDEGARTVNIAFSSETPCRSYEAGEEIDEILSHDQNDVDMCRASQGLPLMLSHMDWDATQQVGCIDDIKIGDDKVMRGVARFGASQLSSDIFADVKSGIRKTVSVGYERTGIVSSDSCNGRKCIRFRWLPLSVSVVPVPADPSVGFGRTQQQQQSIQTMPDTTIQTASDVKITAEDNKNDRLYERTRVKNIRASVETMSKQFPGAVDTFKKLENDAVDGDMSIDQFNARMLQIIPGIKPVNPVSMESIGASESERREYSIGRAIQYLISHPNDYDRIPGLEGEVHREMRKQSGDYLGREMGGLIVPFDANIRGNGRNRRDFTATGGATTGGNFVPTFLQTSVIELLRNRMVTDKLGIQTLSGLTGNVAIPRQTGAATAYSVTETGSLTLSTQAIDQLSITPKRVGATNYYSKQLLIQSAIDVEGFIRDDLMKVLAIKQDKLILEGGGGANEPTGVLHTASIGSVTFGATPTWAKMVEFETTIATANADVDGMAWVTTPAVRGKLKNVYKGASTTYPVFLWNDDNTINGYRALVTNQIAGDKVAFGNWGDCILCLFGGLDIVVDPYTLASKAEVAITINTFLDVAVRHAASFAWSADSGAQ